ncbi:MAG: VCBS repeat-containing protein [Pirellulaceae bacterium]|nr:VCBS repeat-containing protein [Pirellulaceae bacterium]
MFRLACFALLLWIHGTRSAASEPWRRHTIDGSSLGADGVRLADVNGDGLADIATGWEEGGVVRAYVNPGPKEASRPWPAVTVGSVKSPEDAVFADLDGDGATDVVSSTEGKSRTPKASLARCTPTGRHRIPPTT